MKTYNSFFYCCLLSMSVMAADTALWIAPSEDIVGTGTVAVPNGIKDWHIRIDSPALSGTEPAAWRIRGGMWYSMADRGQWRLPYDKGFGHWESLVAVRQSGQRADIYIEPLLAWPGDVFDVEAVLSTKKVLRWKLLSNAEGWLPGGEWLGQGPSDYIGSAKAERDGIREWELGITSPFLEGTPARVDVWLPYRPVGSRIARSGCYEFWSSCPYSPYGTPMPLYQRSSAGQLTISINPVLATGGDEFFVRVVKTDKSWAMWKIIGMGVEWETGGEWLGQEEVDYTGEHICSPNGVNDWHLRVSSPLLRSPVRWIIKGAKTTWEYANPGMDLDDPRHNAAYVLGSGNGADIYLDPVMERAGDIFYVSAVLADGTMVNWGVTSIHELRSLEAAWQGQCEEHPALITSGGITNILQRWSIAVEHDLLETRRPYQWRITRGTKKWLTPQITEEDIRDTNPIITEQDGREARLFIEPEYAKPGTEYNVEALFDDGSLVQWTVCADGAEWAGVAEWRTDIAADYVGLAGTSGPDGKTDWTIELAGEQQAYGTPVLVEITGAGWRWVWPEAQGVSPAVLEYDSRSAHAYVAPTSLTDKTDQVLTIKTIYDSGIVRYWKALQQGTAQE